jgi:hypothetical protein
MSASSQQFAVGSEVHGENDRYVVKTEPKFGGLATVYEVEARGNGKRYMLKLNEIKPGPRESEILRRVGEALDSSNCRARVVSVIDLLVEPRVPGFTGHIEEKALGSSIEDQRPSEQQALRIAIEFAEALHACAKKNIAYLDIKPEKHIFWNAEPWQVTIIDWNVAKWDASPRDLRDDLLTFCRELPAVFRGISQGDTRKRLHLLGWNMETQRDQRGIHLSYAAWHLLARTSVTLGGPLIPAVANLIKVPQDYELKQWELEAGVAEKIRGLVSVAWQSILDELQRVGDLWNRVNRVGVAGSLNYVDVGTLEQASIGSSDRWLEWCASARKNASNQIDTSRGRKSSWRAGEKYDRDLLSKARLLDPQNATAAVALGVHSMWSQVYLKNSEATWKELLVSALDHDPRGFRSDLEEHGASLASEIGQLCQGIDQSDGSSEPDRSLATVWSRIFDDFLHEARAWSYLEEARAMPQPEERIRQLALAQESVPNHPLVLLELNRAREARERQTRVDRAKKSLASALAKSDVEEARRAFEELKREAGSDSSAREYVDLYRQDVDRLVILQTLTTNLAASLATWNREEINRVFADLLKLPPSNAQDLFVDQARQRLRLIDDLSHDVRRWTESFNQQTKSIQAFGGAASMQLSAHELRRMDSVFHGAPQLEGLWQDWKGAWQDHVTWLLGRSSKIIALDSHSDDIDGVINDAEAILAEFAIVGQLQQEYPTYGLPVGVETGKDTKQEEQRLRQLLENVRALLTEREKAFLILLDDPSVLSDEINERFSMLPVSLQVRHRHDMNERQIKDLSRKIQQLLIARDPETATNCLQRLRSLNASPETIRDLEKSIEVKRNVLEAEHLTSRTSDADWLAQTRAFLEKSEGQLTNNRSPELRETLEKLRTQYAQVTDRVGLTDRLLSLERQLGVQAEQQERGFLDLLNGQHRQQDLWDRERVTYNRVIGQFRALAMILAITTGASLLGIAFLAFGQTGAAVAGLVFLLMLGLFGLREFNRAGSPKPDVPEQETASIQSDTAHADSQTPDGTSSIADDTVPVTRSEDGPNLEPEEATKERDEPNEGPVTQSRRRRIFLVPVGAILVILIGSAAFAYVTGFDFGGLLPSAGQDEVAGAAEVAVVQTSTPSPTVTYTPTATPSPTETPTSTPSPSPTSSPSPAPPPLIWQAGTRVNMTVTDGVVNQDSNMNQPKWQYLSSDAIGGSAAIPPLTVISMPDQKKAEVSTAFFAFGQEFTSPQVTLLGETLLYARSDDGYLPVATLKVARVIPEDSFIQSVQDGTLGNGFEFRLAGWVWTDDVTIIQ